MPDAAAPTPLQGFSLLAIEGPDATDFAQAQFCNDVRLLQAGHWQWSGWLTPKGRVIALFALLKLSGDRLLLVLPDAPVQALAAQLQRFVFRSRVSLVEPEGLAFASAPPLRSSPANALVAEADGGWSLDFSGTGQIRRGLITSLARLGPPDASVDAAWRQADIAHGLPRLDFGAEATWTPQMLSLDRLAAYSVKKGCYPGQEIVARTHFLGQAKRGLVRLRIPPAVAPGAAVADAEGRELGRIACVAAESDTAQALAVLPLERPARSLLVGGLEVEVLPLLDGLAR